MQDLIRLVEFDIRGENKVNYFTKEEIELKDKTCNFIIPAASPFFGEPENFKLYNAKGGELKLGKDYTLVGEFIPFCDVSGRSVVSFIELSDEVLKSNSKVFATYISIGAYFIPRGELDKWKDSLHKGKIPIDFEEKVHSIPEVLPPSHHLHNVREEITNWYDITYFYHYLYGLVKGKDRNILTTIDKEVDQAFVLLNTYRNNEQSKLTKHDRDYDNPHSAVSKDIDLGNVPNIGVASPEEILSGKGDDKFLTSESVELLLNGEVEENKDLMLPGVYPISRFGTGGYIPPSISGSFEGLGHENFSIACLEEEDGLVFLAPRFDGKSRGLYYFKMENNVLIPTYHKYDHPFFRTNDVIPTTIYNNSGKDVMMVYDKAGGRLVIGSIGGTLNPEGHTWSFLTLPWGVDLGSATTVRLGRWVYVFRADYNTGVGVAQTVNFRMARFLFDRIGKDQLINAEKVEGLSYTNADGDVKNGTAVIELFKNVPATETTSKQCFFNFTGVLPRAVTMNRYTSPVVKTSIGGGVFRIKFLTSFWVESVISSMSGTIENVFEYNPENPKVLKYVGSSPKYTVTDGFRPSLPGHNPYLGWMFYGGTNQTCWFDEEKLIYTMGSSRSNLLRRVSVDDADVWLSESSPKRHIRNYNVSLANPLGFKPTLGSGVWGNGYVSFISLRDWDGALIRSGFKYNEGFKVRPEVYNESVKDLYSLPLPSKVKPIQLVNVPFRLASNMVPLSEHTTNNKGVPSFGKMFASTNFAVAKGEFSLKLPTKTVIKETEDSIVIEGTTDRTYTKAALESLLNHLKGPKPNWKEYPEVIIAIYEMDGEVAEGKGEVAKVPFFAVIDTYDGWDGINAVVLFNIDKNKLTINPTDIKVVKVLDFITPHSRPQNSGVSSSFKGNQPVYVKVSARDNGTYLITVPTVQYRQISGNGGLDGIIITCTGANTSNPQWVSESGFWGETAIFHDDLGIGVSPSESMALESFRRRDVTGGCSVMINNFLFASTYPQEGWIVYFPTEQDVLVSGSSYRLPIGSLDLRDFVTDPKDKIIYIYASVENNKPFYYASLVEGARSVYHLLVAVVKTSKTKIESIERHQPIHIGDRKISRFREGAILPISTGFPQDDGWFDHLDGEDLGIAKPGPDMPVPTGPVTQFDWRQEHGNVGEYSWTNPNLDYSVAKYVENGYFEDDVQHYIKQGYDLNQYRLVISEWFTYVGQSGEPENKTTHPLMPFVHDDVKKRFKTGYVKPRTDYDKSKYLHIADTYLPTRIERKDKSDLGVAVPYKINDSAVRAKVGDYESLTGLGTIAGNFGEYFSVESKTLKPIDWWNNGIDFDFNRVVINLTPFNSGGGGMNRDNEFSQEYIPLRTRLEKENKYLHEFYFKPKIPYGEPDPNKAVGMFATSVTERYIDKPAPAPSGKALPSIIVKPGNGLLSRGVSKGDLEKNIRGSWWEPVLNNSVTDDRKFYDGRGYNPNTHDLHYYIWEDVAWTGSNGRDMYNNVNARSGKDRIRVDLNHFRQAQRFFATIVSLPKGHKFSGMNLAYTFVPNASANATEAQQLLGFLGYSNVIASWGDLFLNPITQVKYTDWYNGSIDWSTSSLEISVWPIVTRNGGGTLQEQRSRAYSSNYLPKRNELVGNSQHVFEHWYDAERTWKGQTIGGVLLGVKIVSYANMSRPSNSIIDINVLPGNMGSFRTLPYQKLGGIRELEDTMLAYLNNTTTPTDAEYNSGGMYGVTWDRGGIFQLMFYARTIRYEFFKAGHTKNSHMVEFSQWSEPYGEVAEKTPGAKPDMRNIAGGRGYRRLSWYTEVSKALMGPINGNAQFFGYKFVPKAQKTTPDIEFEVLNGDVGNEAQINQLIAACGLGTFNNAWGKFFLTTSRQLKPVDWYNGGIDWGHNKLVFKVWQLNDITAHGTDIHHNRNNRNSGFYNLYLPKRNRLINEHKYVFEHWFDQDVTLNGRVVSGIFITAHVERTAEPPRIIRHQFWYGSRYHKGHVDSCVNSSVVSSYGFDSFPSCRVNVGLEPDSPPPHRRAMAGLFSIPDNCHIVSMHVTNSSYYGLSWRYTNNYAAPGTRNIEILQTSGTMLTIVIGNEIGETITYKLNTG